MKQINKLLTISFIGTALVSLGVFYLINLIFNLINESAFFSRTTCVIYLVFSIILHLFIVPLFFKKHLDESKRIYKSFAIMGIAFDLICEIVGSTIYMIPLYINADCLVLIPLMQNLYMNANVVLSTLITYIILISFVVFKSALILIGLKIIKNK